MVLQDPMLFAGTIRENVGFGRPDATVLDEPTTYLDNDAVAALLANLTRLPWRPTILLITHDLEVAGRTGRTVELREGRIVQASWRAAAGEVPSPRA